MNDDQQQPHYNKYQGQNQGGYQGRQNTRGNDRGGRGGYRSQRGGHQQQQQPYNQRQNYNAPQKPNQMPAPSMPQVQQPIFSQAPAQTPMPAAAPQQQSISVPLPQFNIQAFQQLNDTAQRRMMIGNSVYPAIMAVVGEQFASKITGMIIDENAVDLQMLMTDQTYFNKNINDAFVMLGGMGQVYPAQQQAMPQPQP